jgi:hypothetical protein
MKKLQKSLRKSSSKAQEVQNSFKKTSQDPKKTLKIPETS